MLRAPKSLLFTVVLTLPLGACSSRPKSPPAPGPAAILQAISPADSGKYSRIHDMRRWRNPYLIVRRDGVGLLDVADNAEIVLKPEELLAALARLPSTAWPYGRVVAVSENSARNSDQDAVAIRRNKGIVGGILVGAHVAIEWVPST